MTLLLFAALGTGLLGACTKPKPTASAHTASPRTMPSASPTPAPQAALAGGACLLMDFGVINKALGTSFDVAAAADTKGTYTCEITGSANSLPDLAISVTASDLSTTQFTADVKPSGSKSVSGLGKVGYLQQTKAAKGKGPAIEIGWLSGNDRLIVMDYEFPADATSADATALTAKMTSLAKTVDGTTV